MKLILIIAAIVIVAVLLLLAYKVLQAASPEAFKIFSRFHPREEEEIDEHLN